MLEFGPHAKRVCRLVVTRASVAPQVLSSSPQGAIILRFNGIVVSVVGDGRRRGAYVDFINLKKLSAQSSKMLIGVDRFCVRAFIEGECACVVSV